jgi:hypothetical protein
MMRQQDWLPVVLANDDQGWVRRNCQQVRTFQTASARLGFRCVATVQALLAYLYPRLSRSPFTLSPSLRVSERAAPK